MDSDIQWGDIHQERPLPGMRPDRNPQLTVLPFGEPANAEVPVFIDVDVLAEIEEHANSDTSVELGGVLLGGQHEDESGQPFVLIRDSLRAESYENSRGSFKFTHASWEAISRRREQFPQDLRMVGWYHTHPGWGVFLSSPDQFICEHFFNQSLDVAYVVDPCQGQRDFFCWSRQAAGGLAACRGFWVVGSRFRESQIQRYVARLQGREAMIDELRRPGTPDRGVWRSEHGGGTADLTLQRTVLWSLVVLQSLMFALLLWKSLESRVAAAPRDSLANPANESKERELEQRGVRLDAQQALLERIISTWDGAPDALITRLGKQEDEVRELREHLAAYQARTRLLDEDRTAAVAAREVESRKASELETKLQHANLQLADVRERLSKAEATVQNEPTSKAPVLAARLPLIGEQHPSIWMVIGTILGAGAGAAITYHWARRQIVRE